MTHDTPDIAIWQGSRLVKCTIEPIELISVVQIQHVVVEKKHATRCSGWAVARPKKTAESLLTGDKSNGQVAKAYGVHPNSVSTWKKTLLEKGPEIFARDGTVAKYERRIAELERLIGQKEVEIALLKNFLGRTK